MPHMYPYRSLRDHIRGPHLKGLDFNGSGLCRPCFFKKNHVWGSGGAPEPSTLNAAREQTYAPKPKVSGLGLRVQGSGSGAYGS